MLEETPGLVRFMDRLARLTGGQVFQAEAAGLGAAIVGGLRPPPGLTTASCASLGDVLSLWGP